MTENLSDIPPRMRMLVPDPGLDYTLVTSTSGKLSTRCRHALLPEFHRIALDIVESSRETIRNVAILANAAAVGAPISFDYPYPSNNNTRYTTYFRDVSFILPTEGQFEPGWIYRGYDVQRRADSAFHVERMTNLEFEGDTQIKCQGTSGIPDVPERLTDGRT